MEGSAKPASAGAGRLEGARDTAKEAGRTTVSAGGLQRLEQPLLGGSGGGGPTSVGEAPLQPSGNLREGTRHQTSFGGCGAAGLSGTLRQAKIKPPQLRLRR